MHYGPRRGLSPCGISGRLTVVGDHEAGPPGDAGRHGARGPLRENPPNAVLVGAGAKAGGMLLHARFGKRGDGERVAKPWIRPAGHDARFTRTTDVRALRRATASVRC